MTTSLDTAPVHPLVDALADADTAVGAAQSGTETAGLTDEGLQTALDACERLTAKIHHVLLGLVHETDARDLGRRSGAYSTATWLRDRLRWRPGQARRLVDEANAVIDVDGPVDYAATVGGPLTGRELRVTGQLLAAGAISPDHVAVVAAVMRKLPPAITVDQAQASEAYMGSFCLDHDPAPSPVWVTTCCTSSTVTSSTMTRTTSPAGAGSG
jgi:hypothetical protein